MQGGPAQDDPGRVSEKEKKQEAGRELAEMLLSLHVDGRLSAKDTCTLSYWAYKAGAEGPVKDLAHNPKAPSGHFQRHLDKTAGLRGDDAEFYRIPVPGHTKHSGSREVCQVSVIPPHEVVHRELVEDPDILVQARQQTWPPAFYEHKVAKQCAEHPVPLALYLDGAQYNKSGASVVVFVVCNLASGSRHLVAVLKKRDFCRCGCRGWCSIRPVMEMLNWSFCALASGAFPAVRHDGSAFSEMDERRRSLAGLPLAAAAAVQQIKGDWAEFSHTLGFPTWRHAEHPCLWRRCDRDSMYCLEGLTATDVPWDTVDASEYEEACVRCERHVVVATEEQRARIEQLLYYDKRTQGSRGRSLKAPIPELNLKAHDRLEPCAGCPDIARFGEVPLPVTVVFWRPSAETICRHRNPLFSASSGVSLSSLRVDTLHCMYLGVYQVHCSQVVWGLIECDAWGSRLEGHTTAVERVQASCIKLQADLAAWVRQRRRSHPDEIITEVQEITPSTVGGSRDDQRMSLKGGETKTLLRFLQDFLPRFEHQVANASHMLSAGRAMLRQIDLLKSAGVAFTRAEQQDLHLKRAGLVMVLRG